MKREAHQGDRSAARSDSPDRHDEPLSPVFAALADPTRLDIVARLTEGDATVTELAEPHDMSIQAVCNHLKVLESAGIVSRSREAQTRPVHLEADVFDMMTAWSAAGQ